MNAELINENDNDESNESVVLDSSDDESLSKLTSFTPNNESATTKFLDNLPNFAPKSQPATENEVKSPPAPRRSKRGVQKAAGNPNAFKISFKCSQCGQSFEGIRNLNAHKSNNECPETIDPHAIPEPSPRPIIKLVDNTAPAKEEETKKIYSLRCPEPSCNKIFHSATGLTRHKLTHSSKSLGSFICEHCGVTYTNTSSLKWHMKVKHPTDEEREERERNQKEHKCEHCGKIYKSVYKLKYHIKERHTEEKPFKCHICGVRKSMRHILQQHMKCHDELAKIPCEYCGRPFTRKFELQEHVRAVHLKLRPFECKYCSDTFACRKTLRHHEYIHTGEKPYICDICGIAYRQRSCLRNHKKTHEQVASAPVENMTGVTLMEDADFIIEQIISST